MSFKRPNRMTVETRGTGQDSFAGQVETWAMLDDFWCSIKQLSGRALEAAQSLHAEATHEIRMLFDPRITDANRGKYCGRYFEFKVVQNVDEANVETRIIAGEGLTNG